VWRFVTIIRFVRTKTLFLFDLEESQMTNFIAENSTENLATTLTFNVVNSCQDTQMQQYPFAWPELLKLFTKVHLRTGQMTSAEYQAAPDQARKADKDGAAWIPCSVIDTEGRRLQSNMDQMYALVLDIDSGMALDDVRTRLAGHEAAIHSSYSHSTEKPKWRVVLPFLEPVAASDVGKIFDHFQEKFDRLLDAKCGHDAARLYYLPACPSDAKDLFVFEHLQGGLLNAVALLKTWAPGATTRPKPAMTKPGGTGEGGRNNDIFKYACDLLDGGLSIDDVKEACLKKNSYNTPPLDEAEVLKTVASAGKRVQRNALIAAGGADEITALLNEDYAWVEKQGKVWRFCFRDFVSFDHLRQQHANTGMRLTVGGTDKWLNHAEIWQRSDKRRTHTNVTFLPGGGSIVDNHINLWEGWGVEPAPGDIKPWTLMMDHIFGTETVMRKWFEQWLAYPFQNPGAKMTTAAVLWSVKQGVGKSIIGETIGRLYGKHFRTITSGELHGPFNGWMKGCQFALGEENSSSDQRADANKLKFQITGETVLVNEKHQPAIELKNCANFLFTSNHADAFYLEDADRRFFIWEILAERMPTGFYADFIDWRDNQGGLSVLMHHLMTTDLTGFSPKDNAPVTEAKREMILQSKTELERWLQDATEDAIAVATVFGKEVVHIDEITSIYCRERHVRVSSTAVSKALRRQHAFAKRRIMSKGRRHNVLSLINHDRWSRADSTEWTTEFQKPITMSL
jgi:hypothetical protein